MKSIAYANAFRPVAVSPVLSVSCARWAALDDVRNWIVERRVALSACSGHGREAFARRHRTRDRYVSAIDFLG